MSGMKVKTSVSLSEELLQAVDAQPGSRSEFLEAAAWAYRRELIDVARYSTVICAPVYSAYAGLATQVPVGTEEGLKHDSSIHCDALFSIDKSRLADYVSSLAPDKIALLDNALLVALDLDCAEPR